MADKAISTVRSWLSKLNIKAPWRVSLRHVKSLSSLRALHMIRAACLLVLQDGAAVLASSY